MFVRNLRNYFAGYEKPAKENATRSDLRDPRYTCREFVEDALVNTSPGMLGRVFNEFPLMHPLSPTLSFKWLKKFDLLVTSMRLSEERGEITIVIDSKAEEQTQIWVKELLAIACHELLDDDGKLKQEIVDKLALQPVMNAWKNTANIAEIEKQIIYSYCVQLLLGAVQLQWIYQKSSDFAAHNGDPLMAGQAVRYIEKLLIDDKTKTWTSLFQKQIEIFEESKTELEKCIAKLKRTPNDKLSEVIQRMSQETQTFIVEAGKTTPAIWKKQIELWIGVMHYFKMQNDLTRVQLIHAMLSSVRDVLVYEILHRSDVNNLNKIEKYQLSDDMLGKYSECDLFLNSPEIIELQDVQSDAYSETFSRVLSSSARFIFAFPKSIFYYAGFYQPAARRIETVEPDVAPVAKRSGVSVK
jgi:hypothetical protein